MRKLLTILPCVLLMYACQQENLENLSPLTENPQEVLSKSDLDKFILNELKKNGEFNWNNYPASYTWNALKKSDEIVSIGFKPAGVNQEIKDIIHTIDVKQGAWLEAKEAVINLVLTQEQRFNPSLTRNDILTYEEDVLPIVNLRVSNLNTLERLRASELVRYSEPMGYEPQTELKSSSGCGDYNQDFGLVAGPDYSNLSPNAKASWNHPFHNIANAWTSTSGDNIKIMIIDTGINFDQDNFGSQFNQGSSQGRTIERIATLRKWRLFGTGDLESPNDDCGHGTAMAGVCAAPRGLDGNASGIAYNADLITVRAASDVLIDASREVKGVSDAYVLAGNRSDIRITSMSLGRITSSSQIADAIQYAHNRGKLIFCAGGTSFGWTAGWVGVIFPATMSETVAVTGVKDNNSRCDDCHDGSKIDFTVVMEKASNGRHPITTADTGNQPGTVGGSSVATAQTAGMAALVWARYPSSSRATILDKLVRSGSNYPNRNGNFGWGNIDANEASN